MHLYLRLAWRNIWRHRRRTGIVVIAMSMGLALMMWYDGTVAGFEQEIYGNAVKILGGNIQVHAQGYRASSSSTPLLPLDDPQPVIDAALAQPQVLAASRRIITGGLATSREGAFAVSIVGIEPEAEAVISLPAQHVASGRYLDAADQDVAFIGLGLAQAMDLQVGDRFELVGRAAHEQMRRRTLTVGGIYDVDLPDIEKRTIYISLGEAQQLYELEGRATEVVLFLESLGQEPAVIKAIAPALQGKETDSWQTNFPELQQALGTKSGVMNIFSVIILMIAGIGILNLLLMAVYERTREIGLLGALGLRPRQISALFMLEGTLMGLVGVAVGILLGLLLNGLLAQVGLDYTAFSNATSYMALMSGRVYPTLGTERLLMRALTVAVIAALASVYPAREASLREPAEALHFV